MEGQVGSEVDGSPTTISGHQDTNADQGQHQRRSKRINYQQRGRRGNHRGGGRARMLDETQVRQYPVPQDIHNIHQFGNNQDGTFYHQQQYQNDNRNRQFNQKFVKGQRIKTRSQGESATQVGNTKIQQDDSVAQEICVLCCDVIKVEAAINTTEFMLRENNTGSFPRGLSLLFRALNSWVYNRDPLDQIVWEEPLNNLKQRLQREPNLFGDLIKKYLLNNNHRLELVAKPDAEMTGKLIEDEEKELAQFKSGLDDQGLQQIMDSTKSLKERQSTPDPPELLSLIPSLQISDIPKEVSTIPTSISTLHESTTVLRHDLFTNDVVYFSLYLDAKRVPMEKQPLLPLFSQCLTNLRTQRESFVELTERIDRKTGGVRAGYTSMVKKGEEEPMVFLTIGGKAMKDKTGDLLDVVSDVLRETDFSDQQRIKQLILETKSGMESAIVSSGHVVALRQLSAQLTPGGYLAEQHEGLSQLRFMRQLAKRVDSDFESIKRDLEQLRDLLLTRNNAIVNLTADERSLAAIEQPLDKLLTGLPAQGAELQTFSGLVLPAQNVAITAPTQVNYVVKGGNLYKAGWEMHGSANVASQILSNQYLYEQIRVQGGAYGAFDSLNPQNGNYVQLSYRDPNLLGTVKAYDGTADFLRKIEVSQEQLTRSIIGTISGIDRYMLPDRKGATALQRYLLGITDDYRQMRRDEVLNTQQADIRAFADALESLKDANVTTVTSEESLSKAHEKSPDFFKKVIKATDES